MSTAIAAAGEEFAAETTYLNTASIGLPPRCTLTALRQAQVQWQVGRVLSPDYAPPVADARRSYAGLVGVDPSWVAVGPQVSVFAGLVAASLPAGSEVLTAESEFTSIVFPFLTQAARGITVREVPLEELPGAATARTSLLAVSAVQSCDGRVADLEALAAVDVPVLLDTTQAAGWLPIDAGRFAYTMGGGYKWLLAPRGTCFFTVQPELRETLVPLHAGWYAGEDPAESLYGAPLRLATDARRFDVSPAWHSWVGQAASLELLTEVGVEALHTHAVGLANRFRAAVGMPPSDSAIVSVATTDEAAARLAAAEVIGSVRAGRLRLAFHLNNCEADADKAADVLSGCLLV